MSKLIIVRGIPGTGKSTYAKMLKSSYYNMVHFEADMNFIDSEGNYAFDINIIAEAHAWCIRNVKDELYKGINDVIVSNTFTTFKEMKYYVTYAIENNHEIHTRSLTKEFGSVHNIPEETMNKMRNRFEDIDSINSKILNLILEHPNTHTRLRISNTNN